MNFSKQSLYALDLLENTDKNLFITGRAGTGKSTLLKHFVINTKKKFVILAPTGVAAINVAGQTIHSFFSFHPGITEEEVRKMAGRWRDKNIFLKLQLIIIDEISMVRADLLDFIDIFLRTIRKNDEPFGGVQIAMFGDLFQLPPVLTNQEKGNFLMFYESPYFFSSNVMRTMRDFEIIELQDIYRQNDEEFIQILNAIRENNFDEELISKLNSRIVTDDQDFTNFIYLTPTNDVVEKINTRKLAQIESEEVKFEGKIKGRFDEKILPTENKLSLKKGARVMFLNNDQDDRWVNGTVGTITEINELGKNVTVQIDNGPEVEVGQFTWTNYDSVYNNANNSIERKEIGSFSQFPLKLAWAITIHKSQGKTFDRVYLDLGNGAFAHGQTYVALSRCTSLEGLVLRREVLASDLITDDVVRKFFNP